MNRSERAKETPGHGMKGSRESCQASSPTAITRPGSRTARQPPVAGLLFQGVQELAAGMLAGPAGPGADPAVLMVLGMPLALIPAALADGHAGFQQRPGDAGLVVRLAAYHPNGGGAGLGAVQAH